MKSDDFGTKCEKKRHIWTKKRASIRCILSQNRHFNVGLIDLSDFIAPLVHSDPGRTFHSRQSLIRLASTTGTVGTGVLLDWLGCYVHIAICSRSDMQNNLRDGFYRTRFFSTTSTACMLCAAYPSASPNWSRTQNLCFWKFSFMPFPFPPNQ